MKRSKEMQEFLDCVSQNLFGRKESDGLCITCGSDKVNPEDFRDDLSRKEFTISHICQKCQDEIFEKEGDK